MDNMLENARNQGIFIIYYISIIISNTCISLLLLLVGIRMCKLEIILGAPSLGIKNTASRKHNNILEFEQSSLKSRS